MKSKEELKQFFENGDIPKQEEFWEWQDSYWHKNEKIPADKLDYDLKKKADLVDGKVPASQLPSYVDDVLESDSFESLPNPGERSKIYIVTSNNTQFRWSGSKYIQIDSSEHLVTTITQQDITGKKNFFSNYTNYTPDGLFSNDVITSLNVLTPGGKYIKFGYKDYGSGQYYGRIGFTSETNWSLGAIGNDFTIGTNNDGSAQFSLSPTGTLLIGGNEVYHSGNFNPDSKADSNGNNATNTWLNASQGIINDPLIHGKTKNSSGGDDYLSNATYGSVMGMINYNGMKNGMPTDNWYHMIKMLHNNSSGYYTAIATQMTGGNSLWYKRYENGVDYGFVRVWDNNNFNPSNYLPYRGATTNIHLNNKDLTNINNLGVKNGYFKNLFFEAPENSPSSTYPFIGFYMWGNEWQVNSRNSSNTWVHNLLAINTVTKQANFSGLITSSGYGTSADWNQAVLWGNHANEGYVNQSFVEESINGLTVEITNPDYTLYPKNKFITVIITDDFPDEKINWGEFYPEQSVTIINIGKRTVDLYLQDKTFDRIGERETIEYYVNKEQRLIKKGNYRETIVLT